MGCVVIPIKEPAIVGGVAFVAVTGSHLAGVHPVATLLLLGVIVGVGVACDWLLGSREPKLSKRDMCVFDLSVAEQAGDEVRAEFHRSRLRRIEKEGVR